MSYAYSVSYVMPSVVIIVVVIIIMIAETVG